jgi:hypothetical protein
MLVSDEQEDLVAYLVRITWLRRSEALRLVDEAVQPRQVGDGGIE